MEFGENSQLLEAEKQVTTIWRDFKKFVDKRSAFDLAIGIVIGNAFSDIVSSFVEDIFTPLFGILIVYELSENFLVIRNGEHYPYKTRDEAKQDGAITWNYGNFIQLTINFAIISTTLYLAVRVLQKMHRSIKQDKRGKLDISRRDCPYCFTNIDQRAIKCSGCLSTFTR